MNYFIKVELFAGPAFNVYLMANVKNLYFVSYVLCLDPHVHKSKNNMSSYSCKIFLSCLMQLLAVLC